MQKSPQLLLNLAPENHLQFSNDAAGTFLVLNTDLFNLTELD